MRDLGRLNICPHCGLSIVPRMLRERGGVFDRLAARGIDMSLLIILANVIVFMISAVASGGFQPGRGFLDAYRVKDEELRGAVGAPRHLPSARRYSFRRPSGWPSGARWASEGVVTRSAPS